MVGKSKAVHAKTSSIYSVCKWPHIVVERNLFRRGFALREVSVPTELTLGHLRYRLTGIPLQLNSLPDAFCGADHLTAEWH
ncbi:hypothetical protein NPIL_645751 [Nephila pilipes]|uniref:Uncharacterized protein n=1 Tax=Nephila pilipes TaxID=299642 RepID=A0A8X6P4Y3_NEPPI|nr:hypothetical protein NPIL_354061 [Nephila pilipes]GFU41674.1 hypothetical protein NPIL_645751 [Nephila pilipes]